MRYSRYTTEVTHCESHRTKNPLNHITQYAYDAAGRLIQETAPNGLVTSYSYDLRGRLLSSITGNGTGNEATSYSYTPTGQLARAVLPSGYQVSYSYDAAQRLIGAADNRGNSISYTLDAAGNRLREEVKDPSGALAQVSSRIINNLNRVAAVQGASGQTTALGYDANGQATSQTDPLNQTTRQTLDSLRRPVATTFADNAQTSQSYNALDQLTAVTDPKGIPTSYQRNAFGEVMQESSPDTGSISYQRDALGDITGKQDAKGNNTQITRDALGRPLEVRYSQNNIARYIWDQGGLTSTGSQTGYLARTEDNSGSTAYERDLFGRITAKTQQVNDNPSNPGSFKTAYTYDKGLLSAITYPSGLKVIYNRSASGQIVGISSQAPYTNPKKPSPVNPFVSNLSYTALGQPKAWSWANGDSAARSFDLDARMTANEFASYTFDANSRITGISQNLWASLVTTSTATGTVTSSTSYYPTPINWAVTYDSRDRITSFNRPSAQTGYTYDTNSNRLSAINKKVSDIDLDGDFDQLDKAQTTAQSLNVEASSNKLLGFSQTLTSTKGTRTLSTTNSSVNYALDAVGNMTTDGLRTFSYDEANRHSQTSVSKDGEAAKVTYLHNALGQRVFKSEPQIDQTMPNESTLGATYIDWLKKNFAWLFAAAQTNVTLGQSYVYADEQLPSYAMLGEYSNGGASSSGRLEYIWLPTENGDATPIGLYRGGKFYAVHSDHLNTPRLITDEANKAVWQWPYTAFGDNKPTGILKATQNPNNAFTQDPTTNARLQATNPGITYNHRFAGQYADSETGLFYNTYRTYCPGCGAYTQNDPIGLNGGLNRYSYVEGSPLMFTDPLGLAKSGIPTKVGNSTVRIDKPHVPGQQTHAHVDPKGGGNSTAVNKDGTGSHGATPEEVQNIPNKVKDFLRNKGFNLCLPVPLLICPLCNVLMPQPQGPD